MQELDNSCLLLRADPFNCLFTEIREEEKVYNDKGAKSDFHFASLPLELLFDSQRAKLVMKSSVTQGEMQKQT